MNIIPLRTFLAATMLAFASPSFAVPINDAEIAAAPNRAEQTGPSTEDRQLHEMFHQIMRMARQAHVSGPDSDTPMWEGAINGMLQSLDRHSAYIPPAKHKKQGMMQKEKLSGIGARIKPEDGYIEIVAPITPDSPMIKAGLKPGDLIIEVCNQESGEFTCVPVSTVTAEEAVELIKGKAGSTVRLRIRRETHLSYYDVVRAKISIPVIYAGTIGDDTVYVRMTQFTQNSGNELVEAFVAEQAKLPAEKATKFVFDVRFNPGGLLPEATHVVDSFITGGRIVTIIDSDGDVSGAKNATDRLAIPTDVAVVVLINNFSASASEIIAASLQDHAASRDAPVTLVGEKTFGKGSVQHVMQLPNGGAMKLTVARYYTGAGKMIDGVGVSPDVVVSLKDGEFITQTYTGAITEFDTQLAKAVEVLNGTGAPAELDAGTPR